MHWIDSYAVLLNKKMDDIIKFVKMLVKEDWSFPKTFEDLWKQQVLRASPTVLSM
jgi:hypothetical protein